jgi:hypothetical protein
MHTFIFGTAYARAWTSYMLANNLKHTDKEDTDINWENRDKLERAGVNLGRWFWEDKVCACASIENISTCMYIYIYIYVEIELMYIYIYISALFLDRISCKKSLARIYKACIHAYDTYYTRQCRSGILGSTTQRPQ